MNKYNQAESNSPVSDKYADIVAKRGEEIRKDMRETIKRAEERGRRLKAEVGNAIFDEGK